MDGSEGGGDEEELGEELWKVKIRLGAELGDVKEDEEGVGMGDGGGSEKVGDKVVVKVDYARGGLGLEGL